MRVPSALITLVSSQPVPAGVVVQVPPAQRKPEVQSALVVHDVLQPPVALSQTKGEQLRVPDDEQVPPPLHLPPVDDEVPTHVPPPQTVVEFG